MRDYTIQRLRNDAVHRWYRFVLSFPDHYVADIIRHHRVSLFKGKKKNNDNTIILDPFLGTGTTVVEARKMGFRSIGIEANPVCAFASRVKTKWDVQPDTLLKKARKVLRVYKAYVNKYDLTLPSQITRYMKGYDPIGKDLPESTTHPLLDDRYISPIPWTKSVLLKKAILQEPDDGIRNIMLLTLARSFVESSNVKFCPEMTLTQPKGDAPVRVTFAKFLHQVIADLRFLHESGMVKFSKPAIHQGDARDTGDILDESSVDLVITSPPYPVDKDYTRATRLELAILDMARSSEDLRDIKEHMLRSNTKNIYKSDHEKDKIQDVTEVFEISNEIRMRLEDDGNTDGFSLSYPHTVEEYFGGMHSHFESVYPALKKGATCHYLIGDSRSYKGVFIPTAKICGKIAERLGYEVVGIKVFRDRGSTSHDLDLLENTLILKRP